MASTREERVEANTKTNSNPTVQDKPASEAKNKSSKIWILLGFLILIAAGDLGFRAYTYFKGPETVLADDQNKDESSISEKSAQAKKVQQPEVKAVLNLEPFLVNLADKENIRFVKTTFQLGLEEEPDEEAQSPVAIAAMRDTIISLLSTKEAEHILTAQGKNKLREEIRTKINSIAPKIKVLEVYIVDFVVQL